MEDIKKRGSKLILEGDSFFESGNIEAALEKYLAAEALDLKDAELYGKLISTHKKINKEWSSDDFSLSLHWEMRKQEIENPEVKATHERLSPEWQEVTERLRRLLLASDQELVDSLVEEIASFGEASVRPLLDFILLMRGATSQDDSMEND